MKKYFYIFIFLLINNFVNAQTATTPDARTHLYGIVTNEKEELLIGASVFWSDRKAGTVTDAEGRFWLPKRNAASKLSVQYIGYQPTEVEVLPGEDSLWIELSGVVQLQTVTVTEHRFGNAVSTLDPRNVEYINNKELRKAPCCNLSESFETNGAVDVSYANAITGVKEIQMLGLRGIYSQFLLENRPTLSGIATPFAFEYIPGTWLSGISIAKGASTVKNGFNGISGQISADLVKPQTDKPVFVNGFASSEGRGELNVHLNQKGKKGLSHGLLMHGSFVRNRWDMNNDIFYDAPNREQINALYRVFYERPEACGQINVQVLSDRRRSGQIMPLFNVDGLFSVDQRNDRVEVWGKYGREGLFGKPYNQVGNMLSASWHRFDALYGRNNYAAEQRSLYWQSLYQTIIGNTNHKLVVAPSFQYDAIDEQVNDSDLSRTESMPGAMAEYTFSRPNLKMEIPDLTLVLGVRADWNSRFGWFVTPRMSAKYNFTPESVVRVSAGSGYRSPNLIAENISLLASNRRLDFAPDISYEAAWNYGVNFTQNFTLAARKGSFSFDLYRTDFSRQVLVDVDRSPTEVYFYNAPGRSFSNSLMAMAQYAPIKGLDVKVVYKLQDVRAVFAEGDLRAMPLVAKHRGLVALDYETPGKKWMFNLSTQIVGPQRMPDNSKVPHELLHGFPEKNSPAYSLWNAQATYRWSAKGEIYVGGENLTGFQQHAAIISPRDPWSPYFNGSQLWAPMMRAVVFIGVRVSPQGL